jgi:hypothetical protein
MWDIRGKKEKEGKKLRLCLEYRHSLGGNRNQASSYCLRQ